MKDLTPDQIAAIERRTGVKQSGWNLLRPKDLAHEVSRVKGDKSMMREQLKKLLEHYCQLARQDGINTELEPIVIETRKLLKENKS